MSRKVVQLAKMLSLFKKPIIDASFRASTTFLLSVIAPITGKNLAEKLNLYVRLFDPVTIAVIGSVITVFIFIERYFHHSNLAVSGVFGAFRHFVGIIYLIVFAEMLTSINIPTTQILYNAVTFISINYQPVITLAVAAFAARMIRYSYQIVFYEDLQKPTSEAATIQTNET